MADARDGEEPAGWGGDEAHPRPGRGADTHGDRLPDAVVGDLVARAKRGDGEAFGQLYDRYGSDIYAFVAVRLSDREAAEDMTQTIFLRGLRGLASCHDDAAFPAWIFTIARNSVIDHYRRARFRPEAWPETFEPEDPDLTPEEVVLRRDDARTLQQARERCLSDNERDLFDLLLTDLNDKQIAEVLGRSHGAVRVAHHRLMRKLRDCLRPLGLLSEARGDPVEP